ncbi:MAG: hypothetical protein GF307_10830, partial [candidate division Zixibacteria bacterium]|nr:hypothetical protein [candidate division Zixibacteria bacterium]
MDRRFLGLIFLSIITICMQSIVSAGEVNFALRDHIMQNDAQDKTPVLVIMADRVDSKALVNQLKAENVTLAERHTVVVTELMEKAASTQPPVIAKIEDLMKQGKIDDYTPIWVTNVIAMTATLDA